MSSHAIQAYQDQTNTSSRSSSASAIRPEQVSTFIHRWRPIPSPRRPQLQPLHLHRHPQPQSNHLTQQRPPHVSCLSSPYLTGPNLMPFGRRDCDYTPLVFIIQIGGQNTLSGATYDQLEQLVNVTPPITKENFIRMWMSLMLKRAQDVYEQEKHQRAPNFVRLVRNILLLAPLADLLFRIGQHHSMARGYIYNVVPPQRVMSLKPGGR